MRFLTLPNTFTIHRHSAQILQVMYNIPRLLGIIVSEIVDRPRARKWRPQPERILLFWNTLPLKGALFGCVPLQRDWIRHQNVQMNLVNVENKFVITFYGCSFIANWNILVLSILLWLNFKQIFFPMTSYDKREYKVLNLFSTLTHIRNVKKANQKWLRSHAMIEQNWAA